MMSLEKKKKQRDLGIIIWNYQANKSIFLYFFSFTSLYYIEG